MFAIGARLDELRLVDDAVDVAVRARELKEGFQCPAFTVERVGGTVEGRRDVIAHLGGHIAYQRLEQGLFRIEVGVECAERHSGALRDSNDRAVGKAALAELVASGVEDFAQGALAARGARRLAVARGADLRILIQPNPHSASP